MCEFQNRTTQNSGAQRSSDQASTLLLSRYRTHARGSVVNIHTTPNLAHTQSEFSSQARTRRAQFRRVRVRGHVRSRVLVCPRRRGRPTPSGGAGSLRWHPASRRPPHARRCVDGPPIANHCGRFARCARGGAGATSVSTVRPGPGPRPRSGSRYVTSDGRAAAGQGARGVMRRLISAALPLKYSLANKQLSDSTLYGCVCTHTHRESRII